MKENAEAFWIIKLRKKIYCQRKFHFDICEAYKIKSAGLLGFGLSDRCRRSSLVATPKIIHRMIFVC